MLTHRAASKVTTTLFSAAVVAALGVAAPAASAAPSVPTQGGAVFISGGSCTIGYNDHARGVSYTAGHCGNDGDRVQLYDRTQRNAFAGLSTPMGTFHPSKKFDDYSNDWGEIVWDKGVTLGPNTYSGDTVLTLDQVKRGEEVCYHGETTHLGTTGKSCGTYFGRVEQSFTIRVPSSSQGDSGGPVWVPGRGFIGVISKGPAEKGPAGYAQLGMLKVQGKEIAWAAAPRDGGRISEKQFVDHTIKAAGIDDAGVYDTILDRLGSSDSSSDSSSSDSSPSSSSSDSSSEKTTGEKLAIAIPILAVVLPLLWNIAQQFMPR